MRMMFSASEKKIFSPDFEMALRAGDGKVAVLSLPGTLSMKIGGVHCNTFGEDGCLTDKFKVHSQLDNFGAEAEIFQTIPFGTEFKVKHRFESSSGFVRMTVDVDPGKGSIEDLKLEDIVFEGELKTLRVFRADGGKIVLDNFELNVDKQVFYKSELPFLALQVEDTAGAFAEFGCGNDLWRHRTVELYEHCSAEFTVEGDNGKIVVRRHALNVPAEFAMPKRSFRFKSYIAFAEKSTDARTYEMLIQEKDCMSSPIVRRSMRDILRKSSTNVSIQAENFLCFDAAHLERPGREELMHWSVEDFFEIMLWGSKMLAKNGAELNFILPEDSVMRESGAMKVLQNQLKNNVEVYDEEF